MKWAAALLVISGCAVKYSISKECQEDFLESVSDDHEVQYIQRGIGIRDGPIVEKYFYPV